MIVREIAPGLIEQDLGGAQQLNTNTFLAIRHALNSMLPKGALIRSLLVTTTSQGMQYLPERLDAVKRHHEQQKFALLVPVGQTYFYDQLVAHHDVARICRIFDDRIKAINWLRLDKLGDGSPLPPLSPDWLTDRKPVDVTPFRDASFGAD